MPMVVYVAAGGAIGAVARYGVMALVSSIWGQGFPLGTLVVNILGSFILGVLIETSALAWSPGPEIRAMLVIGVLGAFTTFSAFSLDAVTLLSRGETGAGFLYVAISVVLSIGGLWAGMAVSRYFFQ
ncbi:MAG: fluoride efflux transporter CrcB [Rhodospirillales bacterium]